jgi:hypothetical protein
MATIALHSTKILGSVLTRVVYFVKIYYNTKFYGLRLSVTSVPVLQVHMSAMVKCERGVAYSGIMLLSNFMKIC